jgi:hypothetical protein
MQNLKPTLSSTVDNHPSGVSDVLDHVIAIAPAPLLPGEKQADYVDLAVRIVRAAKPRDAIEEFLVRDVIDLTHLGDFSPPPRKGWNIEGVDERRR